MEKSLETFAKLIVAETLHQYGLDSGELNVRQARQTFGKWFSDAYQRGRIAPVRTDGKTKYFSKANILALQMADWQKAEVYK